MPDLVIVSSNGSEKRVELTEREYILGRDPAVSIPLEGPKVSRKHARVYLEHTNYWVEDLGSSNGVLVDGTAIVKPFKLDDGVQFELADYIVRYCDADQDDRSGFALVGQNGEWLNQTLALPFGVLSVGRTSNHGIVIADGSVSRNHARISVSAKEVLVEDLKSSNGTFVNNARVEQCALKSGDRVRFGHLEFVFRGVSNATGASGIGGVLRGLSGLDKSSRVAIVLGLLSLFLLGAMVVIGLHRFRGGDDKVSKNTGRAGGDLYSAYVAAGDKMLSEADAFMKKEAWQRAMLVFGEVLDRDPINEEGRRGIRLAKRNFRHKGLLEQSRVLFEGRDWRGALDLLAEIAVGDHYASEARSLRVKIEKTR